MAKKVLLLAFEGDPMCCIRILLNALDMKEKGYDVKGVIEGTAPSREKPQAASLKSPFHPPCKRGKEGDFLLFTQALFLAHRSRITWPWR